MNNRSIAAAYIAGIIGVSVLANQVEAPSDAQAGLERKVQTKTHLLADMPRGDLLGSANEYYTASQQAIDYDGDGDIDVLVLDEYNDLYLKERISEHDDSTSFSNSPYQLDPVYQGDSFTGFGNAHTRREARFSVLENGDIYFVDQDNDEYLLQ